MSGTAKAALILLLAAFGAVRLAAIFNDLWMDEIWTVKIVSGFRSSLQVFTDYFQANNHPLSSLFIHALVPAPADWMYRLFSWLTGSASVWLGATITAHEFRRAFPQASASQVGATLLISTVLLGSCYFLILYSSEARGYAPALAFSLTAYFALHRSTARPVSVWFAIYWASCVLALLSHAAAVQVIGAGVIWSLVSAFTSPQPHRWFSRVLLWHSVPLVSCGAYYFLFVRKLLVGGAPEISFGALMGELAAYTFGFPSTQLALFAMPVLGALILLALWRIWIRSRASAAFYAAVILAAPIAGMLAPASVSLFPRYFIFGVAWMLILAGFTLAELWEKRAKLRGVVLACVGLFVLGNSFYVTRLLRHGRGEYVAALRYIAGQTATPDITLCSDHDNRNYMLIDHFAARAAPGRLFRYFPANHQSNTRPQWLLVHRLDGVPPPSTPLYDDRGNVYQLERKFPHAPLSGWDWYVFRNVRSAP